MKTKILTAILLSILIGTTHGEDPAAPYHLQPTSPAIGHGNVADGPPKDLYQNPRDDAQGNPRNDAGAIQYVETPTPPPPPPPSNTKPTVTILHPFDGASFSETATIIFSGYGSDAEDGDISSKLIWTSNLIGQIGSGGYFQRSLPVGDHTIATADLSDYAWRKSTIRENDQAYLGPQQHWIAALQGKVPLLPTAELALNTMLISEGLYMSDKLGREVTNEEVLRNSVSTAVKL